jgi:hypothetical protein
MQVPYSVGRQYPKIRVPENARDCRHHIYDPLRLLHSGRRAQPAAGASPPAKRRFRRPDEEAFMNRTAELVSSGKGYRIIDLPAEVGARLTRLPWILRILLENVLRRGGGGRSRDGVSDGARRLAGKR